MHGAEEDENICIFIEPGYGSLKPKRLTILTSRVKFVEKPFSLFIVVLT